MNMNLKKVISSVAALAMSASCFTAFAATFSDVADTYAYKNAIDELIALKVVNGYEDGTFKPDNEITRAEVTKMVVAAMGPSYTSAAESSSGNSGFSDVDSVNHWASGYISVGVAQNFINGMGDGTFSPDTNVTYAQIVKMLVAALGYTTAAEANGGYPSGYLQTASSIGITANVTGVGQDTAVTRGQVAQLIDNALATPIVAVTGWTQDIYGKPVAQTEIMDGNGDSEKYQTLLTEYHNAYKVRGRVTATHAQGTTEKDQVAYQVEYADNYDGDKYDMRKNGSGDKIDVDAYFGDTNAEDLLFTYSEALIQLDDNDEATILSIVAYGKNDIVELNADDYDSLVDDSKGKTIDFTISSTSSKTKTYKLDNNVAVYVNGVEVSGSLTNAVANYIDGNDIGKVTLIDTPQEGSSSKDGYYDYIMVSVQKWAVVDSTSVSGTVNKIFFDDFERDLDASVSLDDDDEDFTYSIVKDGADVEFSTIAQDNVLLLTYDVTNKLKDSSFVTIDVCDKVVEGKVTEAKNDDDEWIYTIDGTEYTYVDSSAKVLEIGNEYALYTDSTGRIVKYDESVSSKNYAIIDRVYLDNNSGDYKARIIKADGTRSSYALKDTNAAADLAKSVYTDDAIDGDTLEALEKRIITYKLNTRSEIHTIDFIEPVSDLNSEYTENSTKVGSIRMAESTQVVDLTDIYNQPTYTASDIKAASLASFIDGEEYSVLGVDKSTDGYYRFVIILEGNSSINVATHFAVIDSVSEAVYEPDGSVRTTITVYSADCNGEKKMLYLDEAITNFNAKRGDVVVYGVDGDGVVTDIQVIYDGLDPADDSVSYADAYATVNGKYATDPKNRLTDFYIKSGIAKWDESTTATSNGWARVAFGAIIDKNGSSVTIAKINQNNTGAAISCYDSKGDRATRVGNWEYYSAADDIAEFSLASDVNVYVYDYNNKNASDSGRLSPGATGNIIKTIVPDSQKYLSEDMRTDVYNWSKIDSVYAANYAFFKVLDGEITDILVIIPRE